MSFTVSTKLCGALPVPAFGNDSKPVFCGNAGNWF